MKIVTTKNELTSLVATWKADGEKIVLVPTMGCFHEGHQSLMRKGKTLGTKLVVSLFVNPIQFGPNEDLDSYPRPFEEDCRLAKKNGVDVLFCPEKNSMYSHNFQTQVSVSKVSQGLCGDKRPGHFDGVTTVVSKLFHICSPDIAVFGEKDFQQLAVIKQLVDDLDFGVKIVAHPIVREDDGLAMSSRNKYLSQDERKQALCLSKALAVAQQFVAKCHSPPSAAAVIGEAEAVLRQACCSAEYLKVVDQHTLRPCTEVTKGSIMVLAVVIGGHVRLIDNRILC